MSDDQKDSRTVSADTVFIQMYAELRSYRDHELAVATWFTSILLAMLGAIVAGMYVASGYPLAVALERCPSLKVCPAIVPILIGAFGAWSIADAMRRYGKFRTWVTANLESKSQNFAPDQCCCSFIRPGTLMCVILIFIGIFTAVLILHKPSVIGG